MNLLRTDTRTVRPVILSVAALVLSTVSASVAQAQEHKPSLFMVSVGISKYPNIGQLQCAHKDALDVASLFRTQQGKLFDSVTTYEQIDANAKALDILTALQVVKGRAKADSYVILYLAGHGATGSEYFYCAYDRNLLWTEIQLAMRDLPGKAMVFLDTCGAGGAAGGRNLTVFCGCLANQYGMEDPDPNGNGHFTKTLITGLKGAADFNGDGVVTMDELEGYVSGRLNQLSKGAQNTKVLRPDLTTGALPMVHLFAAK